ncbi:protein EFR3 homolog B-like [Halichondria panicea]|uniref:protein EFR3 homolog B-like n=1 Tax=Halichondria panicea TaxID=6063 RepID=UPI00312B69F5
METCFCCPKPRYKRLVDRLFPEDPQTPTPVSANMDKLLFFAQTSPDHLDNIGEYLALRLRRSLQRERNGHVSVALQVTEKLLSACDSRKLQLIVDSYLDILHNMLETSNTELHIMATNSFVKFAEREEGNTPYHRQYDFLIHRFASLSLTKNVDDADKYHETRMAGLQGLRGVIKKIGRQDNLQMNIWDLDHMNKIVPPFLFNMHSHSVAQSRESGEIQPVLEEGDSLGGYSQDSLTELITFAGLSHIDSVLKPILQHFDLNKLWISDKEFTAGVYVIVVEAMQPPSVQYLIRTPKTPRRQDRYKVVQSLVDHLDTKVKESWETKQGILGTLSKCVTVAADSSLGPSVLDIFRTLVRHLRISIETVSEGPSDLTSSLTFQQSITITVGEFGGVCRSPSRLSQARYTGAHQLLCTRGLRGS